MNPIDLYEVDRLLCGLICALQQGSPDKRSAIQGKLNPTPIITIMPKRR